ncbi:hypothetical protein ALISP_0688 [Alicycliphilus sp. B1]|nr:hypothetical protein ALISP_0688 [Alicycliphilus sp. B1]
MLRPSDPRRQPSPWQTGQGGKVACGMLASAQDIVAGVRPWTGWVMEFSLQMGRERRDPSGKQHSRGKEGAMRPRSLVQITPAAPGVGREGFRRKARKQGTSRLWAAPAAAGSRRPPLARAMAPVDGALRVAAALGGAARAAAGAGWRRQTAQGPDSASSSA